MRWPCSASGGRPQIQRTLASATPPPPIPCCDAPSRPSRRGRSPRQGGRSRPREHGAARPRRPRQRPGPLERAVKIPGTSCDVQRAGLGHALTSWPLSRGRPTRTGVMLTVLTKRQASSAPTPLAGRAALRRSGESIRHSARSLTRRCRPGAALRGLRIGTVAALREAVRHPGQTVREVLSGHRGVTR